ncbi:hypothetical protein ES703_78733 [subsurface metagenome]
MEGRHQIIHRSVVICQENVLLGVEPGCKGILRRDVADGMTPSRLCVGVPEVYDRQRLKGAGHHMGCSTIILPFWGITDEVHVREGPLECVHIGPEKLPTV